MTSQVLCSFFLSPAKLVDFFSHDQWIYTFCFRCNCFEQTKLVIVLPIIRYKGQETQKSYIISTIRSQRRGRIRLSSAGTSSVLTKDSSSPLFSFSCSILHWGSSIYNQHWHLLLWMQLFSANKHWWLLIWWLLSGTEGRILTSHTSQVGNLRDNAWFF